VISSQARYDHFDTLPYLIFQKSSFDSSKTALEKCKKVMQEKAAMQDDISSKKLMVKPKRGDETTSIVSDFECCTFDHSDNSPSMFLPSFFLGFSNLFELKKSFKSGLERTDGKNCRNY